MCFKFAFLFGIAISFVYGLNELETTPPFLKNGEKLKFKITYLGITGGYADFLVKKINNNKVKLELRAYTEEWTKALYTLDLSHVSYVERNNFQILKHVEIKNENDRYYNSVQFFFPNENYYVITERNKEKVYKNRKIDYSKIERSTAGGLSIIGAFFYMRTFKDLEIGKRYQLNAFIRESSRILTVNVLRKEKKETFYGKKEVIVVSPVTDFKGFIDDQRGMEIFISNDKYRLPLVVESRLIFGKIKATLIEPKSYPKH